MILKEKLCYVHPLIPFMLELWHLWAQAIEHSPTSLWSSTSHPGLLTGQVGLCCGHCSHPAAKGLHLRYTALLPSSWPMTAQIHCFFSCSWKNNSPRPAIWRGEVVREAHRAGDSGPGWAGSLALSPFCKHKCPLTGTIKAEAHSFSDMPQEQVWEGKTKGRGLPWGKGFLFFMLSLQENQWINSQFPWKIPIWLNNATTTCKFGLPE